MQGKDLVSQQGIPVFNDSIQKLRPDPANERE